MKNNDTLENISFTNTFQRTSFATNDTKPYQPDNPSTQATGVGAFKSRNKNKINFNNNTWTYPEEIKLWLRKHFIIYSRNFKTLLFVFLCPVFFLYLLQAMQFLTNKYKDKSITMNYPITATDPSDLNCFRNLNYSNCVSIGIGIIGEPNKQEWEDVDIWMTSIEEQSDLNITNGEIEWLHDRRGRPYFKTQNDWYRLFDGTSKMYQYIISICYGSFEVVEGVTLPCKPEYQSEGNNFDMYTIIYNLTNTPNAFLGGHNSPYPIDEKWQRWKIITDNAYLHLFDTRKNNGIGNRDSEDLPKTTPKIHNITSQPYPSTASRWLNNANIIASFGSFYLYFPPMVLFSIILLDIVHEKDTRLKHFSILNGWSLFSYWVGWAIVAVIFSLLLTFEILFFGYIVFQFDIFTNVNVVISFALFFLFSLSLQVWAMVLSNYISSVSTATTVSYSVIIIGIVIQTVWTNYTIMYFLYAVNVDLLWLNALLKLLSYSMHFYPPFLFTKCFVDIVSISSSHFDYDLFQWLPGRKYGFNDMREVYRGKLWIGWEYKIDSMFETMLWFPIVITVYVICICLKEIREYYSVMQQLSDHDAGDAIVEDEGKEAYFGDGYFGFYDYYHNRIVDCLIKYFPVWMCRFNPFIYWKHFYDTNFNWRKSNKRRNEIEDSLWQRYEEYMKCQEMREMQSGSENTALITQEYDASVMLEKQGIAGLLRRRQPPSGLRIWMMSKEFRTVNGERIEAVNDINWDINKGESFGLWGPNGAGKTTWINWLSYQWRAGKGYAKVGPFLIHSDMFIDSLYIKKMIGVCGQFDYFWETMTVRETISFFGTLKGIRTEKTFNDKIVEFGLNGKENERVDSLSGGCAGGWVFESRHEETLTSYCSMSRQQGETRLTAGKYGALLANERRTAFFDYLRKTSKKRTIEAIESG